MEPGIYNHYDSDKYHADEAINVSTLKTLSEEGGAARVRYGEKRETKALEFGSLIHTAVLEPDTLRKIYFPVDLDRIDTRSSIYKNKIVESAGRQIVKLAEFEEAERIRDAVWSNPVAREIISGAEVEQSAWWMDPATGEMCRGRADIVNRPFGVMGDLKSCVRATRDGFARAVVEYLYDWQSAWYLDGWHKADPAWKPEVFMFIPVEKEKPYLTATYELTPADIAEAMDEVMGQLRRYARFKAEDRWPGLSPTLELLELPAYRKRRIVEEDTV